MDGMMLCRAAYVLQSLLERNVGTRNVGDPQPLVAEFWSEKMIVRACCLASWTMR